MGALLNLKKIMIHPDHPRLVIMHSESLIILRENNSTIKINNLETRGKDIEITILTINIAKAIEDLNKSTIEDGIIKGIEEGIIGVISFDLSM